MYIGDLIKQLRKERRVTQGELAKKLNIAPTTVSAWERNENRPIIDKLSVIAEVLEVPITRFLESEEFGGNAVSGIIRLPIVERMSCGNGVLTFEDVSGYEPTLVEWLDGEAYFYLRAKGNSMAGARIYEGDLLLIRQQSEIENGKIAVLLIGEEVFVKRFYKNGGQFVLQSENPGLPPIFSPPTKVIIIGNLIRNVIKY